MGSRWGSTYYLFYYQTLGSYFNVCLLCHAMLVDVDWVWVKIRNSDWAEFWTRSHTDISFLAAKKGLQPPYGVATRVQGVPDPLGHPPTLWPPRALYRVDSSSQTSHIFQKYLCHFLSRVDSVWYGFLWNKKHATNRNWHWALGIGLIC